MIYDGTIIKEKRFSNLDELNEFVNNHIYRDWIINICIIDSTTPYVLFYRELK
jgi:acyl-ACP thioesterase